MTSNDPKFDPRARDECIDLGQMELNEKSAQLFACGDLLIACFSDPPGGVQARHMVNLTFESDVFLLAAFRLYLDHVGKAPMPPIGTEGEHPLEC